ASAGLDGGHAKARKAVEHPLEYQLGDEWHREREGGRADRHRGLLRGDGLRLLRGEQEMDADRHVELRRCVPEGVVVLAQVVTARRPCGDRDAAESLPL